MENNSDMAKVFEKISYWCFVVLIALLLIAISSCGASRKSYGERRGLMLLENYEHPRNKKAHKPYHDTKKFKKKIKKHLDIKK
jgi:hypothetical protein